MNRTKLILMAALGLAGVANAGEILVTGDIAVSTTWTANNTYNLQDQIYVLPGATLTIEPGTVIASTTDIGGSLAVCRGAQIFALGTRQKPIVFTSKADVATWTGGDPKTGTWREGVNEWGNLTLGITGTYVSKYRYQREKDGVWISAAGKYSDAGPILRWTHVATADWQYGPWLTTLANRYKSSYDDENNPDRVTDPTKLGHKVDAYSVWDLFVAYKGIKNLTLRAGIKNMFNEEPPASNQGATFQNGYDPRIHDILGRVYTLQASYKF